MLPIDIKLISKIVDVLSTVHSGLEHGHLSITLPGEDPVLVEQAHKALCENLSQIAEGIEMAALCHLIEGLVPSEPEAPTPSMDNVVIFPVETPEA
jgi:hypothetical protein